MESLWSFLTILATFIVAAVSLGWAWYYDRYRRDLEAHESWVSWITALRDEVKHELASLKEMESGFDAMKQTGQLGAVTKRFNEDFFQMARSRIIDHIRSPHVFPALTKTYRDTTHTNGMLDRFEDQIIAHQTTLNQSIPNTIQGLIPSILGSFVGVRSALETLQKTLADEEVIFEAIRPKFFGQTPSPNQDCACEN